MNITPGTPESIIRISIVVVAESDRSTEAVGRSYKLQLDAASEASREIASFQRSYPTGTATKRQRCCYESMLREPAAVTCREWGRPADWPHGAKLSRRLLHAVALTVVQQPSRESCRRCRRCRAVGLTLLRSER